MLDYLYFFLQVKSKIFNFDLSRIPKKNLKNLYLDNNQIEIMPNDFSEFQYLECIELTNNNIKEILLIKSYEDEKGWASHLYITVESNKIISFDVENEFHHTPTLSR